MIKQSTKDEKKLIIKRMIEPPEEGLVEKIFDLFDFKIEKSICSAEFGKKIIEELLDVVIYEMAMKSLILTKVDVDQIDNNTDAEPIFEDDIIIRCRYIRTIEKYGISNKNWLIDDGEKITGKDEIKKRLIKKIFERAE